MFDDFDEIALPFLILYGLCMLAIWIAPRFLGDTFGEGLGLGMKILITVLLMPVVYFITAKFNE
jgi:hypothetical protein|tara:strand:- start:406 stop:597 length:192 start_codon:yes stop_codon:yes gene_type:complete